ncbi:MAG: FAD-dependent oxidoreductase [Pseudomonadota bacterium]
MHVVIMGLGIAGFSACQAIRKNDPDIAISVISDESILYYYRPRLIDFLASKAKIESLITKKIKWYEENRIALFLNKKVNSIIASKRQISLSDGNVLEYDKLLIATGANSFIPPVCGINNANIFTWRDYSDSVQIKEIAKKSRACLVLGGGLLGLEAANSLSALGLKVFVVEIMNRLMPKQLDEYGAQVLENLLEKRNIEFILGKSAKNIEALSGNRLACELSDGNCLDVDFILVSAGVRARVDLANNCGINTDKAIIVNEKMETSIKDIYAAGDCTEFNGKPCGIFPIAKAQGEIAGLQMSSENVIYEEVIPSTKLKVAGIDLVSFGNIDADEKYESICVKKEGLYKKLVLENSIPIGAIMLGDLGGNSEISEAINKKERNDSIINKYFR